MDLSKGYTRALIEECQLQGLLRNQCAYVLATAFWETARTMKPVVEAFWKTEAWRRKNLRYYPWHGRGFVQLTWQRNYEKASRELGLPVAKSDPPKPFLIAEPDAALRPDIAARIIVTGMREGWFTGTKLADYVTLERSDFENARRIVNGRDRAAEIAAIARAYDTELKAFGYGRDKPACAAPPMLAPSPIPRPALRPSFWARLLALFKRRA